MSAASSSSSSVVPDSRRVTEVEENAYLALKAKEEARSDAGEETGPTYESSKSEVVEIRSLLDP